MSRTREQLMASEAQYRGLLDAMDSGFCLIEMKFDSAGAPCDYRFLEVNAAFERETGLVNATGCWMRERVPDHEQHWFDLYGQVARTGQPIRFENPAAALGRWYEVHALRIGDADTPQVAIFFTDITQRRQAENAFKALTAALEQEVATRTEDRNQLWNLSSDIMLRCRFDGTVTAINPAWTDTLGWTEKELLGSCIHDLVHPDDLAHTLEAARHSAEGQTLRRFENRYRCRDGSYRWINWSSSPGDHLINAVGRDCTQDKERAQALAKAEAQLRQSQKMEAVGQLTGGLAHDFNNLLTGISASLEMLQTRLLQGRLQHLPRYIDAALEAARRAAALTHRLLAFSRRQTLDAQPTDVDRLVRDMGELLKNTVGPAVELQIHATQDLWRTRVDRNQLENSLLNLCLNARDAMPDGGRLLITTANLDLDDSAARHLDLKPGAYLCLSVTDSGIGMSEQVLGKAFDPFFTTKPLGAGTGLGLSMVYGFALQSSGQVRLSSRPGHGTTAAFYLPRYEEQEPPQPPPLPASQPATHLSRGETVLVVDDEPAVRMLVAEVLDDLGYTALVADDSPGALAILQSPGAIDLLITDVGLPGGLNGRQLADAARVERTDLKVLFITGYAEQQVIGEHDLEAGMHVMTKPFSIHDLAERIRRLLNTR